jgi:hypothetical protein
LVDACNDDCCVQLAKGDKGYPPLEGFHQLVRGIELDKLYARGWKGNYYPILLKHKDISMWNDIQHWCGAGGAWQWVVVGCSAACVVYHIYTAAAVAVHTLHELRTVSWRVRRALVWAVVVSLSRCLCWAVDVNKSLKHTAVHGPLHDIIILTHQACLEATACMSFVHLQRSVVSKLLLCQVHSLAQCCCSLRGAAGVHLDVPAGGGTTCARLECAGVLCSLYNMGLILLAAVQQLMLLLLLCCLLSTQGVLCGTGSVAIIRGSSTGAAAAASIGSQGACARRRHNCLLHDDYYPAAAVTAAGDGC